MRVALKVDVLDRGGALAGVPTLLRLFETYGVRASFAFMTGPGEGPLWRRLTRREPPLQVCAAEQIRAAVAAGHEVGVAGYDGRRWPRETPFRAREETETSVRAACAAFAEAAGREPDFFAAAGWQLNPHLLAVEAGRGWRWASDTRGRYPFIPQLRGARSACVQIPTTLPTLDEALASGVATQANVHEYLYAESRYVRPAGHVYSARADREGGSASDLMEKLLVMWKGYEGTLGPLGAVYAALDQDRVPVHQVGWGELPGRAGHLAMQSIEVPR